MAKKVMVVFRLVSEALPALDEYIRNEIYDHCENGNVPWCADVEIVRIFKKLES